MPEAERIALRWCTPFGIAIVTYLVHALLKDTDNQLHAPFQLGTATVPRPMIETRARPAVAVPLEIHGG